MHVNNLFLVVFIYQPLMIASIIHRGKISLKSYTDYVQNYTEQKNVKNIWHLKIFDV